MSEWRAILRDVGPTAFYFAAILAIALWQQSFWVAWIAALLFAIVAVLAMAVGGIAMRLLKSLTPPPGDPL